MIKVCLIHLIFYCLPNFFLYRAMPADTSARRAAFSGSVPARGLSAQQQFDRALSWFSSFHAANFQEIEIGDPALGMLRATGSVENQAGRAASPNLYKTNFTVVIRLISGAYRYELRDFRTVPFKKGRYCPERVKSFDVTNYPLENSLMQPTSRHKRSVYLEAERIVELISSSVQQNLAKN